MTTFIGKVLEEPRAHESNLEVLQHALGVDQYGRGRPYRNHFVPSAESAEFETCLRLTAEGLMVEMPASVISGGSPMFRVTPKGVDFVRQESPAPPVLTRSQSTYQAWLGAESGMKFMEWLRQYARTRRAD